VVTESIAFFSVSMGKRPVYILPIYPALSLLMAVWFFQHNAAAGTRRVLYRLMAAFAGAAGLILIVITMGALWRHDPSWFFSPVEPLAQGQRPRQSFGCQECIGDVWLVFHGCVAAVGASLAVSSSLLVGRETSVSGLAACLDCGTSCFHYSVGSHARHSGSEKLSRFHD
jgi:hypothetical protein